MMKLLILPWSAWMGLLSLAAPVVAVSDVPRLIATASVLGSLTVLVYRLGIWRQEMENTKANVGASCARIEQRLEAIDHVFTDYMDNKLKETRRYHRITRRLERLEEHEP
jgi:hypothetical protein